MSNPLGVGRLMDMMLEREVIRNETLLLLISLTKGSEDLRKIVAFEGAFERCFNIIREEGAADGGIIVQDCLELCNNLLRGSPSNQSFFRESSFLHQMPAIVSLKVGLYKLNSVYPSIASKRLVSTVEPISWFPGFLISWFKILLSNATCTTTSRCTRRARAVPRWRRRRRPTCCARWSSSPCSCPPATPKRREEAPPPSPAPPR
jgi:hypothetical protein